ncbi:short chain dehydrogenase reductase [Grosmannia clavigera kw1407]|uniref:Short chain dehydrogenase reductase n=1 Tax=Grosmannia clavigera (strain kw1407 / UAMH 11150) TaxID=655863 RepID=F0XMT9_GROCL|nr:short chain dehydrogenase reductase [Grosmannia clavigera kw1407]EFX01517.1 short chain dehydrogenase reductase [Grosmannia clavigera kw1407]
MSSSTELVVLVTAGSAGLGAAAARLFARNGYHVIVNYANNKARADALLAELNGTDGQKTHVAIQADLTSRTAVERLAREAQAAFGRLDVVFSNGGWTEFRDTTRLSDNVFDEDWDRAFVMNVKSHIWLLHAAEAALAEHEGAFITTASMAGVSGMGSSLAYAACKAAQIHMIKGLACMVGPNIRVNTVSPSMLETEWAERFSPAQKKGLLEKSKLNRFVTVNDVADQVLGLARNRSMTGVNVILDAGIGL